MAALAFTRWPGLMPPNFSAVYGLLFCAGVYFQGTMAWWLPLATMAVSDIALGVYYWQAFEITPKPYQFINYGVYLILIALGRCSKPSTAWWKLMGGGVLGALVFYLLTNTAAWLFNPFGNPEYTRDWIGWITALTQGTAGHPPTWEFLRNTLLSGGLFTGLFAGAMKLADQTESAREKEAAESQVQTPEAAESTEDAEPQEAKA